MFRLAIQKSGRLTDPSLQLITECGIQFERYTTKLKIPAYNFPLEIMTCRDDDIPRYVAQGIVDGAIIGENVLRESSQEITTHFGLGFGKCRLSIAIPKDAPWSDVSWLNNRRIATSYPNILQQFLTEQGITAAISEISGAVEVTPSIGVADAICDLVSSGSTLLSNGLKEVLTIVQSEAVLVTYPHLSEEKQKLFSALSFRIQSVLKARRTKYILLNTPNESIEAIVNILPGLKSPSILPLATSGWSSLHTVVDEDNFWSIIDQVRALGAEGILVLPIEKVIA